MSRHADPVPATDDAVSAADNGVPAFNDAMSAAKHAMSCDTDAMFGRRHGGNAMPADRNPVSADRNALPSRGNCLRIERADGLPGQPNRLSTGANLLRHAWLGDALSTSDHPMPAGAHAMSAGHDCHAMSARRDTVPARGNGLSCRGNQMPAGDDALPGRHHGMSKLPNTVPA